MNGRKVDKVIRNIDKGVYNSFLKCIIDRYGSVYGRIGCELSKALSLYIEAHLPPRTHMENNDTDSILLSRSKKKKRKKGQDTNGKNGDNDIYSKDKKNASSVLSPTWRKLKLVLDTCFPERYEDSTNKDIRAAIKRHCGDDSRTQMRYENLLVDYKLIDRCSDGLFILRNREYLKMFYPEKYNKIWGNNENEVSENEKTSIKVVQY